MAGLDIGWHTDKGVWQRTVGNHSVWAFARRVDGRWQVATGINGKPQMWSDYCDDNGGCSLEEYKAKRRATAMARKLIKGG